MRVLLLGTLSVMLVGCSFATSMILDEATRPGPTKRIESARPTPNPVIAGRLARMVDGAPVQEPDSVTIHGQQFGVAMTRFPNDALCLTFVTARESSRASASRFDPDLEHNYQLVAPATFMDPHRAPFVEAFSVKPTSFEGSYDHTNLAVKDDAVVLDSRYRVGETWTCASIACRAC